MGTLPWQDSGKFIAEASAKVYHTYLSHEPARIALSFALTLLINIIDLMDDREQAMDEVFKTLEGYEDQVRERQTLSEEKTE